MPYHVLGDSLGALALTIAWTRLAMLRSGSFIAPIFARTALSPSAVPPFSSWTYSFIAARSSSVNRARLAGFRVPFFGLMTLSRDLFLDVAHELGRGEAHLLQRIAVADRDRLILRRLAVDRDTEGRAGLILAAIAPADRAAVVVEHVEVAAQVVEDLTGELRHAVLVHEREDGRFERRQRGRELQHDALLALHLFLPVGVAQHDQRRAVRPRRRLDDVRDE